MSAPKPSDSGLTLIELIIVIVLIGILGGAAALVLANSWRTQSDVMSTTQATNRGQIMGQAIEKAVRNADALRITSDGRYVGARVLNTDGTYSCRAFMIQSSTPGDSLVSSSTSPLPLPTSTSWPKPWLANSVLPHGSTPYFSVSSVGTTSVITYTFDAKTNAAPVAIAGQVAPRDQGVTISTDASPQGASPCWS